MNILLNALGAKTGGGKRHLSSFIPSLATCDADNSYVLLVRESMQVQSRWRNIRVERISNVCSSSSYRRLTHDVFELPRRLDREGFDVVVSLTNFGPVWCRTPHVLFQRNALYFTREEIPNLTVRQRAEILLRRRLAYASMKRASVVVTPSDAMTDVILRMYPALERRKFKTIYHGYSTEWPREKLQDHFRNLLSPSGYRILYPSHAASYKGFEFLFRVLARAQQICPKFTFYTTLDLTEKSRDVLRYRHTIQRLGIQDVVVNLGHVPQNQMSALYSSCHAMMNPSLVESFGFAMLEAMSLGIPVIAACSGINQEICGDGAKYFPQGDIDGAANVLARSLQPSVLTQMSEAARVRMSQFDWSWERNARQFVALLEEVKHAPRHAEEVRLSRKQSYVQ